MLAEVQVKIVAQMGYAPPYPHAFPPLRRVQSNGRDRAVAENTFKNWTEVCDRERCQALESGELAHSVDWNQFWLKPF